LYELPKPVIFILDTCEELAKLEPAGAILPSVEATFLILETLHDKVPQIRVVFAGTPLARTGRREAARRLLSMECGPRIAFRPK